MAGACRGEGNKTRARLLAARHRSHLHVANATVTTGRKARIGHSRGCATATWNPSRASSVHDETGSSATASKRRSRRDSAAGAPPPARQKKKKQKKRQPTRLPDHAERSAIPGVPGCTALELRLHTVTVDYSPPNHWPCYLLRKGVLEHEAGNKTVVVAHRAEFRPARHQGDGWPTRESWSRSRIRARVPPLLSAGTRRGRQQAASAPIPGSTSSSPHP